MAKKSSPAKAGTKPLTPAQVKAGELALLAQNVRGPEKPKMTAEQIKVARGGGFA